MSALLTLENVSVGYGEKIVVRGASFKLNEGELCALVGLNGCGKTTILKTISGLLPVKGGVCRVNDLDMMSLKENQRAWYISFIPQRHSKLIGVTVLDAVMMGYYAQLGLLEFPSQMQKKAAIVALQKMSLGHLINEDFSRLSEGQKQMVILTRTLVQNTPIMLMDEPDSALDFQNQHRIMEIVRCLIHNEGKTALFSLHDPNLALAYCDRLILMREGRIVTSISPKSTGIAEIGEALSEIYNKITIQQIQGQYVVMLNKQ